MTETSFQKIKAAAEVRQSQDSENRLDNICSNIPSAFVPAQYGYHRSCYQRFTNVSRIMKRKKEAPNTSSRVRRKFGEKTQSVTTFGFDTIKAITSRQVSLLQQRPGKKVRKRGAPGQMCYQKQPKNQQRVPKDKAR